MRKCSVAAVIVVMAAAALGCAGKAVVWKAVPETVDAGTGGIHVVMTPVRQGNAFYTALRLTITNSGQIPVAVDWNGSGYLFNDKPGGALWFSGITAEAIRDKTVAADTVLPGDSLSRAVAPLQRIAIAPLKESTRQERAFSAGQLPAGKNGIHLRLIRGETVHPITLSVAITADDAQ